MKEKIFSMFACPVCGRKLIKNDKDYSCNKGHCFDVSGDGYVNLLLTNKKNSHDPGDDKNMVLSRALFLKKDYYIKLLQTLEKACVKYSVNNPNVLDLGCGEGYYTKGIAEALKAAGKSPNVCGVDISKAAVKLAAKKAQNLELAVASVFHLPVYDEKIDLMINCFSPLCVEEINRCLKPGGYFLYVVPGLRHLWQLKCAVYEKPYENEQKNEQYSGLIQCEVLHIEDKIHIQSTQDIVNLFQMTPYCWKTSKFDREKLFAKTQLDTQIEFDVHIYKKEKF